MKIWLFLSIVLGACDNDLPVSSFVDKLRVLAVQTEPPEVAPEQDSALHLLAVEPDQPSVAISPLTAVWLACRVPPGVSSPLPCGLNPGELDTTQVLPPACGSADGTLCLIGTTLDASVHASKNLLDSTGTGTLLLTAVVADTDAGATACLLDTAKNSALPTEPDRCVISIKRLVVSDPTRAGATAPNLNPTLDRLDLRDADGTTRSLLDPNAMVAAAGASEIDRTLSVLRAEDSAEQESDGSYEALSLSWFTTGGIIDGGRSDFDPPGCDSQANCATTAPITTATTTWETPNEAKAASERDATGRIHFWAVLRDDRGGVGWLAGALQIP